MKRVLVLATLCVLFTAMVGATVAAAGPSNKYPVTYNSAAVGTVTVKATTYLAKASGLDNGLYHLIYTDTSGTQPQNYDLGPAVANSGGILQTKGAWIG
ncbi:MAG: hypothetical protein WBZ42_03365 [Halobacteriota archaeon]